MKVKTKCRMGNACAIRSGEGECDKFCYFNTREAKTNYDAIVSKTPEELARWIDEYWTAAWCPDDPPVDPETKDCLMHGGNCELCILDWLKQEADNGAD